MRLSNTALALTNTDDWSVKQRNDTMTDRNTGDCNTGYYSIEHHTGISNVGISDAGRTTEARTIRVFKLLGYEVRIVKLEKN